MLYIISRDAKFQLQISQLIHQCLAIAPGIVMDNEVPNAETRMNVLLISEFSSNCCFSVTATIQLQLFFTPSWIN